MLELAVQQRNTDFIGTLEGETGADRREIFKFVSHEYERLPRPSETADFLKRAEENIKAGKTRPAKEVIAEMRRIVGSK